MELGLRGRRALVTGASRGIGRAIALELAAEGMQVLAVARNIRRLEELALEAPGGSVSVRGCDLADGAAIDSLGADLGRTDVLVINTGGPPPGFAAQITDAQWLSHFESMFLSAVRLTRLALPGMRQRRFGRIMAVISSGVVEPIPNLAISNAVRAALVGWAKTLAGEVAGEGVTVNCLAPGNIDTERLTELGLHRAERQGLSLEEIRREAYATIPAGRYGAPSEFAAVAAFLAGERASYVTGGIVRIDGGMIRCL